MYSLLKARQVRCWRKRFSEANGKIQNYYLKLRKKILTLDSYVRLSFPFLFKLATFDVKRPALFDSLSKAHCNFEPNRAWAATYQEKRISWKLSRLCLTINNDRIWLLWNNGGNSFKIHAGFFKISDYHTSGNQQRRKYHNKPLITPSYTYII